MINDESMHAIYRTQAKCGAESYVRKEMSYKGEGV